MVARVNIACICMRMAVRPMVPAMSSKVETLIQDFVQNLRQAIAEDAAELFRVAAGGPARGEPALSAKGALTSRTKPKAPPAKVKGGKRTSEEIERQAEKILASLKKNPL